MSRKDKETRGQGDKGTRGWGDMLLVPLSPCLLVLVILSVLAVHPVAAQDAVFYITEAVQKLTDPVLDPFEKERKFLDRFLDLEGNYAVNHQGIKDIGPESNPGRITG